MDHRAQAGDEGHQEGDGQHGVSVGGDGHGPGVVLLLVEVEVVEGVGEDDDGDGGEREETGRHQEQRRAGRAHVGPAEADLRLDLLGPEEGEGEEGVEQGGGQAGDAHQPGGGDEGRPGAAGQAGEDDEALQQEEDPGGEVGDVEAGHHQDTAHLVLWQTTRSTLQSSER